MSSPLAIAAVTAAMKDLLNDGLLNHDLASMGSFSVTAMPPDRVTTGATENNQLNLFLYQVSPNQGWRNEGLPTRDGKGTRVANPPLALDLHYLLTAYGRDDFNAEILLGYAMQLFHETPVLTRQQLRAVLGGVSPVDGSILPSPFGSLSAEDLADQMELIKISPVYLSAEELSKMWTAMQSRYRPTMAYTVSVVLIQGNNSAKSAPPVLKRGKDDGGYTASAVPFPTLTKIQAAASELLPALRLGDDVLVTGSRFNTPVALAVRFEHTTAPSIRLLSLTAPATPTTALVHIPSLAEDPDGMHDWAIGAYRVALRATQENGQVWSTNSVLIALAPRITVSPNNAAAGDIVLTITCAPRIQPGQETQAALIFGTQLFKPDSISTPANEQLPTTLVFTIPAVAVGEYLVRLRVDGIDSLPVNLSGTPSVINFDPQQKVVVA